MKQLFFLSLTIFVLPAVVCADEVLDYSATGRNFVSKYCEKCHNDTDRHAELSLSGYRDSASLVQDRRVWDKVLRMVISGEMPPQDAPRPASADADAFVMHVKAIMDHADRNAKPDPGRVTMRRLNRLEYRNTIRDLIGITFDPTADFPSDDIGHGFDNIGDVLSLSPVLMERYLTAAESIMEQAIVPVASPVVKRHLSAVYTEPASGDVATKLIEEGFRRVSSDGQEGIESGPLHTPYKWEDGDYLFRTRVYGQSGTDQPVRVAILLHGKDVTNPSSDEELSAIVGNVLRPAQILKTFEVTAKSRDLAEVLEVAVPASAGRDRMMVGLLKPAADQPPARLWVEYLALDGPLDTHPASHRRLLAHDPQWGQAERTREVLGRFLRRAWRRRVTADERYRLCQMAEQAMVSGESWESAMQLAMQAALCSPSFLFRVEADESPANPEIRPLTEYQLASRLSYFLWSSMPDDQLLELADAGQLSGSLQVQVQRMLADPKSTTLVRNFAMQWLQLQRIEQIAPDSQLFPTFNSQLRAAMLKETELFVESVLREDRSLLDLISADYTWLNEPLAKHYGIVDTNGNLIGQPIQEPAGQAIHGEDFVRVSLKDRNRGGLLTQASILAVTSNPTRTSPVKRGRWILEQILGSPPPAPPPNVPELPSDDSDVAGASLRQRLEVHRSNPACANCHAKMDPIGFALENFDAIGQFRTRDGNFDIDVAGELPDGTRFSGAPDLKNVILARKQEFARCVCEKLLIYALGRGLEYYDRPVVESILKASESQNYRFSAIVMSIVQSEAFRLRRGIPVDPAGTAPQ